MFGSKPKPLEFVPVRFTYVERHEFATKKELEINIKKADKEGFHIVHGKTACGYITYYMNLYRDPRRKKRETVRRRR